MPSYKRGSSEELNKLLDIITESCENLNERSNENEKDVQRIKDSVTRIYLDFIAKNEAARRVAQIKNIDVPDFIK